MLLTVHDLRSWAKSVAMDPETTVSSLDETSSRQLHMVGVIRAFHLMGAFLCGMGVFQETAHFRKEIAIGEALFFAFAAFDAMRNGIKKWYIPGTLSLATAAGAVINSMEPGIFTKDKRA